MAPIPPACRPQVAVGLDPLIRLERAPEAVEGFVADVLVCQRGSILTAVKARAVLCALVALVQKRLLLLCRPRPVKRARVAHRLPHRRIALEAAAETDLPHVIALLHSTIRLHPPKLVPYPAAAGVAKVVERGPGGLHHVVRQREVVLHR